MSFCAELKTRFVELLKAKQAFDVAYAEDSQAVGDWQTGRWEKSLKVVKTLQNSRDKLEKFRKDEKDKVLSDIAAKYWSKQGELRLDGLTTLKDKI